MLAFSTLALLRFRCLCCIIFALASWCVAAAQPAPIGVGYRVFFHDKGPDTPTFTQGNAANALATPLRAGTPLYEQTRALHTARAIARRRKVLPEERLLTVQDAPLYKPYLDSLQALGARVVARVRWQNYVSVDCDAATAARLAQASFVRAVQSTSRKLLPASWAESRNADASTLIRNIAAVKSPAFAQAARILANTFASGLASSSTAFEYGASLRQLTSVNVPPVHALGITGKGIRTGFMDSGFRWRDHDALRGARVIGEWDAFYNDSLTTNKPADSSTQDEHGTWVFSCVAGMDDGVLVGVAPNAEFALAKTEYLKFERHIEEDHFAAAMEWLEASGIDITNASLGYSQIFDAPDEQYFSDDMDGRTPIASRAVNAAAARGVLHCNSAGNDGPNILTLNVPADADGSFAVASARADSNFVASRSSSRGPRADGIIKPDIAAQGEDIVVAGTTSRTAYRSVRGTSFSSPLVAGAATLMLSAFPELTPAQVRFLLATTASQATRPDIALGFGTANLLGAMLRYGMIVAPELASYPVYRALRVVASVQSSQPAVTVRLLVRFAGTTQFRSFPMQSNGKNLFVADLDETLFAGRPAQCYVLADDGRAQRRVPVAGYPNMLTAQDPEPLATLTPTQSFIPRGLSIDNLPLSFPTPDIVEGVRPSPVSRSQGQATLMMFTPEAGPLQLTVVSALGQTMYDSSVPVTTGLSNITFPVGLLSSGMYVVQASYDGARRAFPFVVTGE
jgi:subtilisin family serine protease